MIEDSKQNCFHLNAGGSVRRTARAKKKAILLTIRTQAPLKSKRMRKVEQVSANRYHCDLLLIKQTDIDTELLPWLIHAANLVIK